MKTYIKPYLSIESLIAEAPIAADALEYAAYGEKNSEELSVPARDDWYEDLT